MVYININIKYIRGTQSPAQFRKMHSPVYEKLLYSTGKLRITGFLVKFHPLEF
jgi:hypothetical protein